MIKNERQYRITKAAAEKFEQSLMSFDSEPASPDVHPVLRKAERDAIVGQLDELRAQLREVRFQGGSHFIFGRGVGRETGFLA